MKREKIESIIFTLVVAFGFLVICSRSSFIYPFNNWDDSNSYFSMGKVLMNGGVLYRDAFDQKGPLLYFIYGIGYLLSNTSFAGVFVLEVIALFFAVFAEYKLLRLYLSHRISLLLLPVGAFMITVSKSFYWGGCAEEFCLPLLMWGLYFSMKYFKESYPEPMLNHEVMICGILAGCIMMIKYTILGFYIAWMGVIVLVNLNRRNWKQALWSIVWFLGGFLLPIIPWFVYFGIHGALADWYHAYVYCNVFLYSDVYSGSFFSVGKIYDLAKILYWLIWDNMVYFATIIIGFFGVLLDRSFRWIEKINIYMLFGFMFLGIYIGGTSLFYYSLPLSIFSCIGLVMLGKGVKFLAKNLAIEWSTYRIWANFGKVVVCVILLVGAWNLSMNTEYSKEDKEDFFLHKFRDVVLQKEEPTLLTVGCLDIGLYTVADIMPTCKYFQSNMVRGFDEVGEQQLEYIREGKIDFIVTAETYPSEILERYEVVCEAEHEMYEGVRKYYLFGKR